MRNLGFVPMYVHMTFLFFQLEKSIMDLQQKSEVIPSDFWWILPQFMDAN